MKNQHRKKANVQKRKKEREREKEGGGGRRREGERKTLEKAAGPKHGFLHKTQMKRIEELDQF